MNLAFSIKILIYKSALPRLLKLKLELPIKRNALRLVLFIVIRQVSHFFHLVSVIHR